jgi:isocitrate/isopropylmalate dehydrogenase
MSVLSGNRVAVIAGDGIGPEVVSAALEVVAAAGVVLETVDVPVSAGR